MDDPLTRQLLAYTQLILDMARRHGGKGWLTYDRLFREHLAAGSTDKWEELNPSLMAATMLGAGAMESSTSTKFCSACMAADHSRQDCALTSLEPAVKVTGALPNIGGANGKFVSTRPNYRPRPYNVPGRKPEICQRFNRGICFAPTCKYEHACSSCFRPGHNVLDCKAKEGSGSRIKPTSDPSAK